MQDDIKLLPFEHFTSTAPRPYQVDNAMWQDIQDYALRCVLADREGREQDAEVREAVQFVLDTFKRDESMGYRSKDRQFAIDVLEEAMKPTDAQRAKGDGNG